MNEYPESSLGPKDKSLSRLAQVFLCGIVCFTAFMMIFSSCFEETFEPNVQVDFITSVDTLRFDTVFTSIGSATRSIVVRNPTSTNIIITSIALDRGSESMFRLNVDGTPGNTISDIPILAGDSLHLFLEVTVDPDLPLSESPFVIEEQLIVNSGGREKVVNLEAWGQNANYFPNRNTAGQLVGLGCNGGQIIWDDPKPYVIFGLLFIDSCELVIPAGTQIFVHGGLAMQDDIIFGDGGLFFLPEGTLTIEGTVESPVVFQGDRLERGFQDVPGQWAGLRFLAGSKGHSIRHAEIRNSTVGIRADSASQALLSNVTIANTTNVGIIAIQSELSVDNTLIYANGAQSVAMIYGGSYDFRHCTFANYQNQASAVYMDNFNCLNPECNVVSTFPLEVNFQNSIIMGSNDDEININDISEGMDPELFSLSLDHTLLKVLEQTDFYPESACINCIEQVDEVVFVDEFDDDFRLDTMSIARDRGLFIEDLPVDLVGAIRDMEMPDLGCFEIEE